MCLQGLSIPSGLSLPCIPSSSHIGSFTSHSSQAPIWTLVLRGKTALCLLHSQALLLPLISHSSCQVIFIAQAGPRRGFVHHHSTSYKLSRTPCVLGYLYFYSLAWPLTWPFTAPCAQCLEYDHVSIFFLSKVELKPV